MCPVNMAQKAAKEKKNRQAPLWAKNHTARQGRASAHMVGGSRASSTSTPHRATAATGSSRKDSPARYWVTNRVSRRMGRACIMQAERLL